MGTVTGVPIPWNCDLGLVSWIMVLFLSGWYMIWITRVGNLIYSLGTMYSKRRRETQEKKKKNAFVKT